MHVQFLLCHIIHIRKNCQAFIDFFKLFRKDADSVGRLFHSLAHHKEKYFCSFADFFANLHSANWN